MIAKQETMLLLQTLTLESMERKAYHVERWESYF